MASNFKKFKREFNKVLKDHPAKNKISVERGVLTDRTMVGFAGRNLIVTKQINKLNTKELKTLARHEACHAMFISLGLP